MSQFWSHQLVPGDPLIVSSTVINIRGACFGNSMKMSTAAGRTSVQIKYTDRNWEERISFLCNLTPGKVEQVVLDVLLTAGTTYRIDALGKNIVFLTGTVNSHVLDREGEPLGLETAAVQGGSIQSDSVNMASERVPTEPEMAVPTLQRPTRGRPIGSPTKLRVNTKRGGAAAKETSSLLDFKLMDSSQPSMSVPVAQNAAKHARPTTRSRTQVSGTKPSSFPEVLPPLRTLSDLQTPDIENGEWLWGTAIPSQSEAPTVAETDLLQDIIALPTATTAAGGEEMLLDQKMQDEPMIDFKDGTQGQGRPILPGNQVTVRFKARVGDSRGAVFQQCGKDTPYKFRVGDAQAVPGLSDGVIGMRKGGSRVIFVPPILAYGDKGFGVVPPNSKLVIECQVLDVSTEPTLSLASF